MRSLLKTIRSQAGPAFVMLELVMHIYLSVYLTFHWTNLTIWGFTAFETVGFVYLLAIGKGSKHHQHEEEESLAVKHMRHYQYCGCLGDSAICCRVICECKRG